MHSQTKAHLGRAFAAFLCRSLSCEADLPRFSDHIEVRISTFGEFVGRVIAQSAVGSLAVILTRANAILS
jgi:hypothetical protein